MTIAARSPLLAKSPRREKRLTLFEHLVDTDDAACALFRAGTRWAHTYLRFFKLGAQEHEVFLLHLRTAALFHDIGKANEDFQAAMLAKGFKAQSLRHEHISALLICEPAIADWLSSNSSVDVDLIASAVLTHHLKAMPDGEAFRVLQPKHKPPTTLYFDDQQVIDALRRVAKVLGLPELTTTVPAARYYDSAWRASYDALFERAQRFSLRIRKDAQRRRLSLAIKAGLIACDSVSSGLWREGLEPRAWIQGVAHRPPLGSGEIDTDVLAKRIEELRSRGKWQDWHGFQNGAAAVGRRGLLLAPCGAGKTLAAWRWASAISRDEPIGRVIFLYPTRGTATEGFRDYVAHAPEGEAALVHGTADYELAGMMTNPEELPVSLKGKNVIADENEARLFALGLWNKRYFAATVDQFLGFMEHSYRGICLLPALADAAVVFDEVHSYDPKMWNALVAFLEHFDVPVLCMTATLPPARREQLERRCGLRSYPSSDEMRELADLEASETCARYRHAGVAVEGALSKAVDAVRSGRRVLWVVNTVSRCQKIARLLKQRLPASQHVGVYHSRFKLDDRQQRHRDTIDAFRSPAVGHPGSAIAVTTQVCEMSLDLDADVLITEHAPISSLVQRFGRAHRHLRFDPEFRAELLTYAPESALPYDASELRAAVDFLNALGSSDITQRDLARALEQYAPSERDARGSTAFIDGGYFASAGDLREADELGVQVVLDEDIARFRELRRLGKPTHGLILTVPKKAARPAEGAELPAWLRTADSSRYHEWLGFLADDGLLSGQGVAHG